MVKLQNDFLINQNSNIASQVVKFEFSSSLGIFSIKFKDSVSYDCLPLHDMELNKLKLAVATVF
ncbi:hypothetical protein BpHYR1_024171 [Brachionus plicatilis]|uniref:Uncharacterized protein n=1 Tax=Brachionus plicatilis TaxID=10195 RepID=A0A3M7T608_BRAPC|nr:hypothetical protein BpHYR1_024171 [Brachionus plicatilis]